VFNMGSRHLSRHAEAQFAVAWEQARSATDLSGYKYSIAVPASGGTKTYNLDLEAFSSVLRHPGMALSCHYSISQPRSIQPHTEGFITDVIRHMENKEIAFYDHLPWSFREGNGGLAEVESPFRTNLTRMGVTTRSGGTFAEIKLNAPEARELLRFVGDHDGMKGTRKGFAEIYSGNFGMRGFNTFLGKARANSILTPITWAMEDISKQAANGGGKPVTVLPLSEGCYLQYWLDLPPTEGTRQVIKQAVDRRIHSENGGPGYASISFRPVITLLDASTVDVISAKQAFILKSLDKESYPVAILDRTDFLINFLQNINEKVQQDVFKKLAIGHQDRDCIAKIRYICSQRRTLRNTEDVVWTLRTDEGLRPQIKHVRHELEDWVFRFAGERFDSIYRVLADKIRERMNHRH
jgi:hypothetical protein